MYTNNRMPSTIKRLELSFYWEIVIALLVKFTLLAGLWWLFFAGGTLTVDETSMAGNIFGAEQSLIISEIKQEHDE